MNPWYLAALILSLASITLSLSALTTLRRANRRNAASMAELHRIRAELDAIEQRHTARVSQFKGSSR